MKRSDIAILILRIPLTFGVGVFSFFIAREIRRFGDMIPGIALPPHTLGDISLLKFALVGSLLYLLVHAFRGGFRSDSSRELFGIVR